VDLCFGTLFTGFEYPVVIGQFNLTLLSPGQYSLEGGHPNDQLRCLHRKSDVRFDLWSAGVLQTQSIVSRNSVKNGMIQVVQMHRKIQSLIVCLEQMTESIFNAFSMWKTRKTALSWIEFCRLLPRTSGIRINLTIPYLRLSMSTVRSFRNTNMFVRPTIGISAYYSNSLLTVWCTKCGFIALRSEWTFHWNVGISMSL
jgi:hypothetical protein